MAGLIKGQILKHLSKFVLNLNPNQISLSALKGEGELLNLELNCAVLTELLELPVWVRLVQATCNRAAIRIQWTKLKTVPIQLSLDEIRVKIETCEDIRGPGGGAGMAMPQQPLGAYGFSQKVVDGISMSVNLVHVTLTSLAFTASFQMSRIVVESKSPSWQKASLPHTRLKEMDRGEVLIFKELSWQTVRIEARSTVATDLTPLRLITNQARCRITLKKRMSDCGILGVRLVTILDDLLWVLTDDQLKAALHFVGSVSGLVKKATEETQKVKAARKLDNSSGGSRKANQPAMSPGTRTFAKYDVTETSYHFYSDRIDLHFCDDPGGGRSEHPELQGGGAFQVSLAKLQVDYYPYHLARGDRKHWVRYSDTSHRMWLNSNLASFDTKLLDVLLAGQNKTPLSRGGRGLGANRGDLTSGEEGLRDLVVSQLSRLMTTNIVVRLADLTLWRVSTSSSPSGRASQPQELLKGDCARLHLPPDLPLLHMELTQFYYPGDLDFPLPPPCLLLTVNPVTVWLDVLTFIWLNSFTLNLQKSVATLQESLQLEQGDAGYADVKVELVMPRIICSPRSPPRNAHTLRPSSLQISASKISLANYRSLETGSRADLATALDKFQQSAMFFGGSFPCRTSDPSIVCQKFWSHATGTDCVRDQPTPNMTPSLAFKRDLLWTEARDVWHCAVSSVWAEFTVPCSPNRPIPLLDATPLSAWVYARPEKETHAPPSLDRGRPSRKLLTEFYGTSQETSQEEVGVHVLALASQLVSLQLDHHQLVFLLRLAESLSEMGAFLSSDSVRIVAPLAPPGMVIGAVLPQLDVSVILPGGGVSGVGEEGSDDGTSPEAQDTIEEPTHAVPTSLTTNDESFNTPSHKLEPVYDQSDPLSLLCDKTSTPQSSQSQPHPPLPEPPVKLQLLPSLSNGLPSGSTPKYNTTPTLPQKSRGLTSSFNSMLDGLGAYTGYKSSPDPYLSLPHSGARSPDCDMDNLSVRSDDSGESNWQDSEAGWTMVSDSMDVSEGLFRVERDQDGVDRGPSPAEMAEEVLEGLSEAGGGVGSLDPADEARMINVMTLHLGRLAIAQMSGQRGSSILLDATSLATSLGGDQDYQQFQFRFGQSGKAWSESTLSPPGSSAVKLRLDSVPPPHPAQALEALPSDLDIPLGEKIARVTSGLVEIEVTSLVLSYTTSILTRLGEWAQDEIIATPLPMAITLSELTLHLTDDAPPPLGCPPPPPIDLLIPHLTITRDKLGMFSVSSGSSPTSAVTSQPTSTPSQVEKELRNQLDTALAEVRVLRARLGEGETKVHDGEARNKELSTKLEQVKRQMEGLVEEKKSLLDTLRYLQEELLKSGKK